MSVEEISFEEGLEIIANFIHQATIKGIVKTKTDKEKAILLQALSNMESFIENEKNRFECGQLWKQISGKDLKCL